MASKRPESGAIRVKGATKPAVLSPTAKAGKVKPATSTKAARPATSTKAARPATSTKAARPSDARAGGLRAGDRVPSFELLDHTGTPLKAESLRGQAYVLYFYPKDDTPGCTREACAFQGDLGRFEAAGVRIIGVSPDKPESHARFRAKYGLRFTLLSDAERTLAKAFGVWVKKQNYGREYMGVERSTFLVEASGKIKKVWRGVKVDGHAAAVHAATAGA
jgi:peroxiredoxin Q/BCP